MSEPPEYEPDVDAWLERAQESLNALYEQGPPFDPDDWFDDPLPSAAYNLAGELWSAKISGATRETVQTLVARIWGPKG